ncbi:MAG: 4-hydroxythreonine-4-phosphate dehydrogenase PdxA [Legionellaceae bacterium]|nr:4-hydroxythreonine-4-phosphate dehydrogenase PdxA [Legionellaceae bacterium]
MKPLLVTSGEPAGIGPDICLTLKDSLLPIVVLADSDLLLARAYQLGIELNIEEYIPGAEVVARPGCLTVWSIPCNKTPIAGKLDVANAEYVLKMLKTAAEQCLSANFSAVITAPIHKGIINQSGISFTGHTEFFANICGARSVVMLLASKLMRVALATTHIPLKDVSQSLTKESLQDTILTVHSSLQKYFGILKPKIIVAGLNPHAGENGYLGREEIDVIAPVISEFRANCMNVIGPLSADTMFSKENLDEADAFIAMYHDQGLPVLKYSSFGTAVNVSLGLPIIRTSVDHGTALDLAGKSAVSSSSLIEAVEMAYSMAQQRE